MTANGTLESPYSDKSVSNSICGHENMVGFYLHLEILSQEKFCAMILKKMLSRVLTVFSVDNP